MSVSIFFSYSHEDEKLRDKLAKHLSALKRNQVIQEWHDRMIPAGSEWKDEIDRNLNTADIILLLVSASFLASEYCWSQELERAMARHEAGEACVIPVILRPFDWEDTPFAKLQMLPKDAKAVTSWSNEDEAFTNVAQGIRGTVRRVAEQKQAAARQIEAIADFLQSWQQPKPQPQAEPSQPQESKPQQPAPVISTVETDDLSSDKGMDYAPLQKMLKTCQWREADRETWRVMCAVMGRQEEGWLRVEDVESFPCADLRTIDQLWVKYSKGKWGFSVQKRIWQECGSPMKYNDDWKKFGDRVGWRKDGDWLRSDDLTYDLNESSNREFPFGVGVLGGGDGWSLFSRRDL